MYCVITFLCYDSVEVFRDLLEWTPRGSKQHWGVLVSRQIFLVGRDYDSIVAFAKQLPLRGASGSNWVRVGRVTEHHIRIGHYRPYTSFVSANKEEIACTLFAKHRVKPAEDKHGAITDRLWRRNVMDAPPPECPDNCHPAMPTPRPPVLVREEPPDHQ